MTTELLLKLAVDLIPTLVSIIAEAASTDPPPTLEVLRKRLTDSIATFDELWLDSAKAEAINVYEKLS